MTPRSRKTKETASDLPCCGVCEYFTAEPKDDEGKCWRYPPSTILSGENLVFLQPIVQPNEWCGEFRRRVS